MLNYSSCVCWVLCLPEADQDGQRQSQCCQRQRVSDGVHGSELTEDLTVLLLHTHRERERRVSRALAASLKNIVKHASHLSRVVLLTLAGVFPVSPSAVSAAHAVNQPLVNCSNTQTQLEQSQFSTILIYYSSQHLKWIKKVHQSCTKTRMHFGFRF